jgi:deazaflavin-dependent oxidoreductase (nitroreductase family)
MSTTRFYKRPTALRRRVYDPLMRTLIQRVGFSGILDRRGKDTVQVLSVRGRRTGRLYHHPVGVSVHNGHRYLVGFYGQTEWALNLRAGTEAALSSRGVTQPIRAIELTGAEKADFMRFLVQRYRFFARAWLKVNPNRMDEADLARLLRDHPVFQVENLGEH